MPSYIYMAGDMLVLARLLCWLALEDFGSEMDVGHHMCIIHVDIRYHVDYLTSKVVYTML